MQAVGGPTKFCSASGQSFTGDSKVLRKPLRATVGMSLGDSDHEGQHAVIES